MVLKRKNKAPALPLFDICPLHLPIFTSSCEPGLPTHLHRDHSQPAKTLHLAPNLLLAIPSNLACCSLPPELLLSPRVRAVWMYWGTGQKTRSTTWHAGTWTSSLSAPQRPATQWEGAARTHKSCLGLSQQDGAGAPVPVTPPTSAHFAQSNPKYLLHPLKPQK